MKNWLKGTLGVSIIVVLVSALAKPNETKHEEVINAICSLKGCDLYTDLNIIYYDAGFFSFTKSESLDNQVTSFGIMGKVYPFQALRIIGTPQIL